MNNFGIVLEDTQHFTSELCKYIFRVAVIFKNPYTIRTQSKWCMVSNNIANQKDINVSRVSSGGSRLHNNPKFRNNTHSVPVES